MAGMPLTTGRWRIVDVDLWDSDAVDLLEPGLIEFTGEETGGSLSRPGARDTYAPAADPSPPAEQDSPG
ncbi:hypothetical protein [Sciscionella marina]|uniref:hypothetical protein n=1 Tax=Sciscionella marina TaxID=508770 RepID=UPI00038232F2|nr:hypothetical protein [Sciscionella marina]